MRHHGIDRDEEGFGYLLVGEALHDLHDDFLLALAEGVVRRFALLLAAIGNGLSALQPDFMLEPVDALGKERVLHVAMAVEVFVRHENVHEHFAHERCVVVAGVVLHDDALELAEALLDAGVLLVVLFLDASEGFLWQVPLQQRLHIGMHMVVLEGHVPLHLLCILVVEAQDEHRQAVSAGEVDGLEQLAPDARQAEIDEVAVGVLQVGDERRHIHLLRHLADAGVCGVFHIVDDRQECADIHSGIAASGLHRLVAKAELDAETAYYLQDAIVITDDVAHRVCGMIFLGHLCYLLFEGLLFTV